MIEQISLPFETIFSADKIPKGEKVVALVGKSKLFCEEGLAPGTSGNISFREGNGFVITVNGAKLSSLSEKDFVEIIKVERGENFKVFVKGEDLPSSETLLHYEIYQRRPEINAIFHLHDSEVTSKGESFGIPCTLEEKPGGTYQLAQEAIKLLGKGKISYFILRNHGIVCLGKDIDGATKLVLAYHKAIQGLEQVFS